MYKRVMKGTALVLAMSVLLCGCGGKDASQEREYEVTIEPFTKVTYDTVAVEEGDLCPVVELSLSATDQKTVDYRSAKDDMTVKSYNAERGDVVEAGQVLVTFESEDMDNEIAKYEAELAENQLLLDHCKKMIALKSKMYDEDSVKSVEQDISVCSGYLEELKKKKESYSIKAEGHGVIGLVSNALSYGHVDSSDTLLSISYGSGCFYADTDDPFAFEIGKIYTGVNGAAEYKMKLVSIVEPKDNPDSDKRRLTFEYQTVDGEIPIFDSMDMVIEKNTLKNVTYVTEDAVLHGEDGNDYLSVVGEDGFGYQRAIKVDSYVDGYAIISEGVESGERVIIQ